jgi:hypothetical protein
MLRSVKVLALAGLLLACVCLVFAEEDKKPKYTIKQVMAKAMKGGLCVKVASGKASDKEKEQLVELFTALGDSKPPRGGSSDWKERTGALVEAAKGSEGAKLRKAADCKACHSLHKGK